MTAIQLSDVAASIAMSSSGWSIVVAPSSRVTDIASELYDELRFQDEISENSLEMVGDTEPANMLVERLSQIPHPSTVIIVAGRSKLVSAAESLDASRTRFIRGPRIVLVTDVDGARTLASLAPNLWSFVSGRYWTDVVEIPAADIHQRLTSLREEFGLTHEEVVRAAEQGNLPLDPVFAEWLALLGRGDLLGR